jgi:hypothetical protein
MKKMFLTIILLAGVNSTSFTQKTKSFDVGEFENELIQQMKIAFPGMTLDTTLRFATEATSQKEAGYPECYATKKGGMVNTSKKEIDEAIRIVNEYKKHIEETLYFDDQSLKRCHFTEFCASATLQYGGLVRYGIVIDNNITRESIIKSCKEITSE